MDAGNDGTGRPNRTSRSAILLWSTKQGVLLEIWLRWRTEGEVAHEHLS